MKSLKIFALIAVVFAIVSSCSKSEKDILTSTTWLQDSVIVAGTDQLDACDRDDYVTFTVAGKAISTPMGVACDPGETADTSNYSLSEDAKTFIIEYEAGPSKQNITFTVNELTSSRFSISGSLSGIPVSVKYRAK
jgi:hypothetical protein